MVWNPNRGPRAEGGFVRRLFARNPHWKYIAPAMTVLFLLSIVPTLFLFGISFTNYQLGWKLDRAKFVDIRNYTRLFSGRDVDFWHAVEISLEFMVLATLIQLALGFVIALMLNKYEFKLKPLLVGILIVPLAMTPTIAGQMWKLMFNAEYGLINYVLTALFNWKVTWLSSDMAFWSILIVDIWQFTPFVTLILYAGLRSLPTEPLEAAMIDGASPMRTIFHITIPMMKKLIFLALLLRAVDALKLFDTAFVLTQGGPGNATEFLSLHVYRLVNAQNGLLGRGAAV
ncbi:MAG: sugar ABC transporter permease, partial [Clostridiales bacterium]|nr:sugar ABC transporter permease [Clostridiales bacterium]